MSRCYCCNVILTPSELSAKFSSGSFTEMCNKCLSTIDDDVVVEEGISDDEAEDDGEAST